MKITIETTVRADLETVWHAWSNPEDIKQWNAASDDWTTSKSLVDLRVGGSFLSRMEARDGSIGFDFGGVYTRVEQGRLIEYLFEDGRMVEVQFSQSENGIKLIESFDPETETPLDLQRSGWQSILDNFKRFVESQHKG